jgi:hypothetical protein
VRVAGYLLRAPAGGDDIQFNVAIPAEYKLLPAQGSATGLLDGTPCNETCFLSAGPHRFRLTSPATRIALVWAQGAERNFSPFGRHRNGAHRHA